MRCSFYEENVFSLFFEPEEFFLPIEKFDEEPKGGLSVARGWTVIKIDSDKKLAFLDDGTQIEYEKCLLATGIHPKIIAPFDNIVDFKNKVTFSFCVIYWQFKMDK